MEHLELDERLIPTGASEATATDSFVLGSRTYDDGYTGLSRGATFALSGGGRRVVVRLGDGYPCAQVYAPADDDVICFEPMTAPTNALVSGHGLTWVRPGSSYTATFAIEVS
jgi:galactose mutarotase-like enzyme